MDIELTRHLPAFIAAAQTHNFSAAARQLGVTPAAISKNIKTLEAGLDVRLFHRSTHALSLTDEGAAFYNRICPVVNELKEVLSTTRDESGTPAGKLRISLAYQYGRQYVVPLLKGFLERYPQIELDMRFEDRIVDLFEEGIDLGIGNQINQDASIVARPITDIDLVYLASPEFLKKHGTPQHPNDLEHYNCIVYRSPTTLRRKPWQFCSPTGERLVKDNLKSSISVTNPELGLELAVEGIGISPGPLFYARELIEQGKLVPILTDYQNKLPPMMIYYPSRKQIPAKSRVFIDYLLEHLGADTHDNPATGQ
ncbi:LysR family transcriptional regulator [Ferrimonas futtsuensis]|uniref:LysR family transcriptional regulator n=1 Tax=Ferrimonas futtsuensis TaxID=364764 RepID=UPI00041FEA41|nr:LysR family transcriptional regulator [Ferrimonas futtsuensis]